jgi:hypothetical protein
MKRAFNTIGDIEVQALVSAKLAELTGDQRFNDYWKFVREYRTDVHLQRILDHSTNTKGYRFADLEAKAQQGIPALMNSRTTPKSKRADPEANRSANPRCGRCGGDARRTVGRSRGAPAPSHRRAQGEGGGESVWMLDADSHQA